MLKDLYQALNQKVFKGEEWRILKFFQKGDTGVDPPKYTQLLDDNPLNNNGIPESFNKGDKNRLTEKMSRLILLVEPEKFVNSYKKQFFRAYQKMMIGRFLRYLNWHKLAKQYAYQALKIGYYYQLQEVIVNTTELLMMFASLNGNDKLFYYYKQLHLKALHRMQIEGSVKTDFMDFQTHFAKYSKLSANREQELSKAIKRAEEAYSNEGTYMLLEYLTRLRSFYYELHQCFRQVQLSWAELDNYVKKDPQFYNPIRQGESTIRQMKACLNLVDTQKGKALGESALSAIPSNSLNWFYYRQLYALLLIRTQQYESAYKVLQRVFTHKKFTAIPHNLQEIFLLLDGFLGWVGESSLSPYFTHPTVNEKGYFPINKLVNDLPGHSQDKYGVNALIVLLKVLFYINRLDFQSLYSQEEPVKLYKNRYLRHQPNQRMFHFFDLLQVLIKFGMDLTVAKPKNTKILNQLQQTNFQFEGGYEDFEFIPFEQLWSWIQQQLKAQKKMSNE